MCPQLKSRRPMYRQPVGPNMSFNLTRILTR